MSIQTEHKHFVNCDYGHDVTKHGWLKKESNLRSWYKCWICEQIKYFNKQARKFGKEIPATSTSFTRTWNIPKTHCSRGHVVREDSYYYSPNGRGYFSFQCLDCSDERHSIKRSRVFSRSETGVDYFDDHTLHVRRQMIAWFRSRPNPRHGRSYQVKTVNKNHDLGFWLTDSDGILLFPLRSLQEAVELVGESHLDVRGAL